ncbi:MAG: iron ABC transporter permease [Tissierellia bacterium]|nr:iron ABC transporter permease [Tissierellia bacterium]
MLIQKRKEREVVTIAVTSNKNRNTEDYAVEKYKKDTKRKSWIILLIILLTLMLALYALNKGAAHTTPIEIMKAMFGLDAGISNIVLWNIRLPRILAAIIAGAGLGIAGCVMQTSLRNPLASPSTLGISSAAAFGANIAIVFFGGGAIRNSAELLVINNPYIVTLFAFLFSMVAMMAIIMIAQLKGFSPEAIVLAGVAFSSLFSAGTTLIQFFAEDHEVAAMVFWTFGDLGRISWTELKILFVVTLIVVIYLMLRRWDFNAMDSGEDSAKSLGVNVNQVRMISMLAASILTAVTVSFMGIIGFIGLVAPQMMRRIIGGDHRLLIPASAATGALILLLSDTLARTVISPIILPVGAITSFFGAPLFLFLLIRGYTKK